MKILFKLLILPMIGIGLAMTSPAGADESTMPVVKAPVRLDFPQGRDELTILEIRHYVTQYLIALGLEERKVGRIEAGADDLFIVEIVAGDGAPAGEFGVDAVTAEIIPQDRLRMLRAGAESQCGDYQAHGLLSATSSGDHQNISIRLRRHMLGDGLPWAPWVGGESSFKCNDYRDGGPLIPNS